MSARRYTSIAAIVLAGAVGLTSTVALEAFAQKPKSGQDQKKPKPKPDKDKKPKPKPKGDAGHASKPPAAKPDGASAPPATAPASPPVALSLAVTKLKLGNGLRVVFNVDKTSPTVAVAVTYDVGSRNEERGKSGFAHLFEHMMFQGSKNVPKGDHFKLISSHGGVLNGTTSADRTNYFQVLPANELALALWLEADRMKSLAITAENFENQRKVVQDEYRMRVSNVAYVPSQLRLEELVFLGYWPYEHSTIGSMADLDAAKLDYVADFFAKHYAPNNAVLTIAGDFDADEAVSLVKKYFDAVPAREIAKYGEQPFPEQTSQRTAVLKDAFARVPNVLYGWAVPPFRSPDHYALEIAADVLGGGESSRLHQILVRDKALCQGVSVSTEDRRGPDLFVIDATLSEGAKVGEVQKIVEAELKKLATQPPSEAELAKSKRRVEASLVLGLQSNVARATRLGQYETFFGDARLINAELPAYLAVTKEDVRRVATEYLGPTRRTIVETYPAGDSGPAAKPAASKTMPSEKKSGDTKPARVEGKNGGSKPASPSKPAKKDAHKSGKEAGSKKGAGKGKKP